MELRGVKAKLFYCFIVFSFENSIAFSQITIAGSVTSLCSTSAGSGTYSVTPIANATYNWTAPVGMIITNGQGTSSITTSWTATAIFNGVIGDLCVTIDSMGTIYNGCITIDLNAVSPLMPDSITGIHDICTGDTIVYATSLVPNASSYTWNLPTGTSLINGSGTNSITLAATTFNTAGILSVIANNSCGNTGRNLFLIPNVLPAPTAINGMAKGVCKMSGMVYYCPPVANAVSYVWTVVGFGATIVGATNDTSVVIDFDSTATTVTISVNAINACGNGVVRNLTVTGKPGTTGPISGPDPVCKNTTQQYSVMNVFGATSYTWTSSGGTLIVSGQGTTSLMVHFDTALVNNIVITVAAANDCGVAAPRTRGGISVAACIDGIEEHSFDDINLFPNPTHNELTIDLKNNFDKELTTEILDVSGRTVFNATAKTDSENHLNIDLRNLSRGVYFLLIHSKKLNAQKRFIID